MHVGFAASLDQVLQVSERRHLKHTLAQEQMYVYTYSRTYILAHYADMRIQHGGTTCSQTGTRMYVHVCIYICIYVCIDVYRHTHVQRCEPDPFSETFIIRQPTAAAPRPYKLKFNPELYALSVFGSSKAAKPGASKPPMLQATSRKFALAATSVLEA